MRSSFSGWSALGGCSSDAERKWLKAEGKAQFKLDVLVARGVS
jgi:hypothetical protein